ncbi:MAG: ferrous iron transport protein A [Clostridia bacterium]|nr:ferrous iron transport protein A [Clostridia bacterium]
MQNAGSLNALKKGEKAKVTSLAIEGPMRRRLTDLGIVVGTVIECVGKSPCGDPCAYLVRSTVIALRKKDAAFICCESVCDA